MRGGTLCHERHHLPKMVAFHAGGHSLPRASSFAKDGCFPCVHHERTPCHEGHLVPDLLFGASSANAYTTEPAGRQMPKGVGKD
ncbi:hypothetical protein BC832DRAFT_555795 [Gaertneriomyces semiglobifer]|nr:hypothetical protein BC832DRAFT_555795 [Gaertneriomyces semiglobifer]